MKLKLIPPTPPPASERLRQRLKANKPACVMQCRCGSREAIEVRIGALLKNGRPAGGTRQLLCAACLIKGERVVII